MTRRARDLVQPAAGRRRRSTAPARWPSGASGGGDGPLTHAAHSPRSLPVAVHHTQSARLGEIDHAKWSTRVDFAFTRRRRRYTTEFFGGVARWRGPASARPFS